MKLSRLAALAGALMLFPVAAVAQSMCTVTTQNLVKIPLPNAFGAEVVKLRAGPVLGAGRNDIVALTETGRLVLVRDGFAGELVLSLAEDIIDFTVATVDGQRAQVVAIGAGGLFVGTYAPSGELGPTLKFSNPLATSNWNLARKVDAASQNGVLQIVAAHGATLLRATYNPSNHQFVLSAPATVPAPIEFLAVADLYAETGVEVAVGSSAMLHFYKSLTSATIAVAANPLTPMATASFIDVQRIPKGADVRDSIGVVQRHPATDVFYEVTSAIEATTGVPAPSAPIASGGLRHAAMAYSPIGLAPGCVSNCTPTDLVFLATTSETLVFQGDPQAAGGMQFSFDPAQLSALNLAALVGEGAAYGLNVAAGDLDGDGDGDLAYAGRFELEATETVQFVLVRNDCTTATTALVDADCGVAPDPGGGSLEDTLGFNVSLRVPKPPTFPVHPTHVQVTIYVREYSATAPSNPLISPYPIFDRKLALPAPVAPNTWSNLALVIENPPIDLPAPWNGPPSAPPLLGGNVIAYVQVTPVLDLENSLELLGPSSNFIGSFNVSLLDALCVNESANPDEFFNPDYCQGGTDGGCQGADGAPLINEIHRRKRIRPKGTPPQ
jgi:hypothetical protein